MPVVESIGSSAGTSTAFGFAFESTPGPFSGVGSAAGTSTAQAYSSSEGVGIAAGVATAIAVSAALSSSGVGAAAGVATVTGAGQVVVARQSTNPKRYLLRIAEKRDGANGISEIDFVPEDLSVYPPDIFAENPLLGSNIHGGAPAPTPSQSGDDQSDNSRPGSTRLLLLDFPQLLAEHNQPGLYAAASGLSDGWSGTQLFKKVGQEYIEIARLGDRAVIGRANTKLDSGDVTLFDEDGRTYVFDDTNTVDVTLIDGVSALASVSDADLFAGVNIAAIGVHGRWELVGYGNVEQLSERKWRLSHLLRGLKGTEWAIGTHKSGDTFVVLDSALRRVTDEFADLNVQRKFRGVSVGNDFESANDTSFTNTGVSLKPLSPVFIRGEEDGGQNRTLRWYRRSRLNGLAGRDTYDPAPPLGETIERYEVDILNSAGTSVLRTITAASESAFYTAAQQTADFGSVPSSLRVKVYQLSETRGRGYGGEAVISLFDEASAVELTERIYDIYLYVPGKQRVSRRIAVFPLLRPVVLPATLPLSRGLAKGGAATAESVYSLQKNGVEFGTATFDAAADVAEFDVAADTLIDPAVDSFEVVEPASPDATLADVGFGFAGVRV